MTESKIKKTIQVRTATGDVPSVTGGTWTDVDLTLDSAFTNLPSVYIAVVPTDVWTPLTPILVKNISGTAVTIRLANHSNTATSATTRSYKIVGIS